MRRRRQTGATIPVSARNPIACKDEDVTRDCRSRHKWKVIAFDRHARKFIEKCVACGRTQRKGW